MTNKTRIWELLAKRLSGEIDSSEMALLNALMKEEGIEDGDYMIDLLESYALSVQNAPEKEAILETTRQNKEKVMAALEESPKAKMHMESPPTRKRFWWYAAAICLLVGLSAFFLQTRTSSSAVNVVSTENGSKSMVVLPDGTQVWLNADSRLSYANNFKEAAIREVTLSGEAYFKIKHDANQPFIIHTEYFNIKDLGTAFNVRSYPDENKCETTLIEGSITVSLRDDPGKKLHLDPGEKFMYYPGDHQLVKSCEKGVAESKTLKPIKQTQRLEVTHIHPVVVHPGDTVISEIAWLDNQLVFNNESFVELARRMNRFFNVEIIITSEKVQAYSFTGIFEGETLQQALNELQMIRPFSYTINKNRVVIDSDK